YIINEEKQFLDAESNPISFYGLLSKAQHHGFPTPLLDWAKSPYVASFFAFEQVTSKQESNKEECVFVYFFDVNLWKEKKIRNDRITMLDPRLFLEVIELPSTFNQRAAAQQSVFMLTNVEHVDSWLGRYGVLKKIGIKLNQRKEVMQDLEAMGITRKSLFPGLDGMCAFLKEREFRYCNEIQ
ncbi:MAG: FRG domain-containing protein, partial [Candidatus Paceibacterota bacterium]